MHTVPVSVLWTRLRILLLLLLLLSRGRGPAVPRLSAVITQLSIASVPPEASLISQGVYIELHSVVDRRKKERSATDRTAGAITTTGSTS